MATGMKKKGILICVLALVITVLIGGAVAVCSLFVFHEGYPIYHKSEYEDMRDRIFTAEAYESLKQELPDCDIQWMVPFGNTLRDSFVTKVVLDELEPAHIPMFSYLERLEQIDASKLRCYDDLIALQDSLPDCHVEWYVHVGSLSIDPNAEILDLDGSGAEPQEILDVLPYLPRLSDLKITDVQLDGDFQDQLTAAYPHITFTWNVEASGRSWANTQTHLSYAGQTVDVDDLIEAAHRLPLVEFIDLSGCGCTAEELLRIKEAYGAEIYSELSLFGQIFDTNTTELNFNDTPMEDTSSLEQMLPLMPMLTRVEMCNCGISSEEMDTLSKRYPEVRFIWTVKIGRITLRTDVTGFIGAKHGYLPSFHTANHYEDPYNRLFDKDCAEFKYCTDMVCLDLGHMGITDYSFMESMTNMKYLMLVDTIGTDFSFLQYMPELIYLELFLTDFSETEYLIGLTKLKDLNIAFTDVSDITYLKQMTWLERLWISRTKISYEDYLILKEALPNTKIDYTAPTATEHGWRSGYLYFEMRDYLGMYYLPDKVYD